MDKKVENNEDFLEYSELINDFELDQLLRKICGDWEKILVLDKWKYKKQLLK